MNRGIKMNSKSFAKVAASGLVFGSTLFGFTPMGDFVGSLASASASAPRNEAASFAKQSRAASAKGKIDVAVTFAEKAVQSAPQNADMRMMLGEAYLKVGRFISAESSFDDALNLVPDNSRAALKLALAKIALGKNDAARSVLDEYRDTLSAADYGLAVALSGDVASAVSMLEAAARSDGDAQTRQNLALTYALSGRWAEARTTAAQDLSPDLIDARMTQWAQMARPKASWDQVAGLLGVQPSYDIGQPAALALNMGPSQTRVAAVAPAPAQEVAVAAETETQTAVYEAPAATQAEAAQQVAQVKPAQSTVVFAPRQEIVQAIRQMVRSEAEAPLVRSQVKPMKTALAAPRRVAKPIPAKPVSAKPIKVETASVKAFAQPASAQKILAPQSGREFKSGQFAVQLGAFASKAQAEAAWVRAAAKTGKLAGHKPMMASVISGGKTLKRLAAAGYSSRAAAEEACQAVKASGGECFVRSFAGVELAQWVGLNASGGKAVKVAARAPVPAKPTKIASR
jgi:Flp pilus assembly protein TadD